MDSQEPQERLGILDSLVRLERLGFKERLARAGTSVHRVLMEYLERMVLQVWVETQGL